jgi:hypothetical protein
MTTKRHRLDLTTAEVRALMDHLVRTGTGPDAVDSEALARVAHKLHNLAPVRRRRTAGK